MSEPKFSSSDYDRDFEEGAEREKEREEYEQRQAEDPFSWTEGGKECEERIMGIFAVDGREIRRDHVIRPVGSLQLYRVTWIEGITDDNPLAACACKCDDDVRYTIQPGEHTFRFHQGDSLEIIGASEGF